MKKRHALIALSCLLSLAIIYVGVINWQTVTLQLAGSSLAAPMGLSIILSFILGLLAALPQMQSRVKEIKSEQIQIEWQNQDAKLQREITSDKEKQLEAKIETLEAALKQALKKK